MRLFLHAEPLVGLRLLLGDALPDLVHQDLATTARDRVEAGLVQLAHDLGHRDPEALREEDHFRRREAVNVDRMMRLDVAHQLEVPVERDVRVVAALQQDLRAADRLALVDLGADLFKRQHIPFVVLRPPIEGAEGTVGHADVGVVDVAIDDVRHRRVRVEPVAGRIGQGAEFEQRGALVELERLAKLAAVAIHGAHSGRREKSE